MATTTDEQPAVTNADVPKLQYNGNVELPVPQLKTLKNHLEQLYHRIFELQAAVIAQGRMQATPWSVV
jgi:hypothetical protein